MHIRGYRLSGLGYLGLPVPMTFMYFCLMLPNGQWPNLKLPHIDAIKPCSGIRERMSPTLRIEVEYNDTTIEVVMPSDSTVGDLLRRQRLHPDSFIVMIEARPVPITRTLVDGERLRLIKVASGG